MFWGTTADSTDAGGELSVISSNRIIAPKPQEITSRKATLEASVSESSLRRLDITANLGRD